MLLLILHALESHPTLEALTLCQRYTPAAHDTLLRVIAVDSAALHKLRLYLLRDDELSLAAVAGALQQNRHLQDLRLMYDRASVPIDSAYEEHLLPAVLACTSLRKLDVDHLIGGSYQPVADSAAVVQLVADREVAGLAAELAKEPGRSA